MTARHPLPPWTIRLGWLVLIWFCSVAALGVVGALIRFWLKA